MKIHVTGGSGFLGRRVIPRLIADGHAVSALARSAAAASTVEGLGAAPVAGDLDDPASVDAAFRASGAEGLVNLASLGFGHAPTIVAAAEDTGLKRAIFISTTAIFTTLNAPSRAVRVAAEETIRSSGLDWTIIRPTMIYGGADDRNMARLVSLVSRSPVIPMPGGGRRLQQPVHVGDLADAVVAALSSDAAVGVEYDIAGPDALTFEEIVDVTAATVGKKPKLITIPLSPVVLAVRLYERVARRPRLKAEQLERLAEDKAFDISRAARDLGYSPRSFADGMREPQSR